MTEGRQILMTMFQGGGNIPLLLPIVTRLVARGHRVRVLVGSGVRRARLPVSASLWKSLQATGAEILRLREPKVHPWDAAPSAQGLLFGWTPQAFRSVAQEALAQLWLPHWARKATAELRRAPADVLVTDYLLVGALVAAEALGIPATALVHNVYPRPIPGRPPYGPGWAPGVGLRGRLRDAIGTCMTNRLYAQIALPALNQARRDVGLSALRVYFAQYDRAARVVLASPHFDFPARGDAAQRPARGHAAGRGGGRPLGIPRGLQQSASPASWSVSVRSHKAKRRSWNACSPRWRDSRCAPW